MSRQWTIEDSCDLYNLERWGTGYFGIDSRGHLTVRSRSGTEISVLDAVFEAEKTNGLNAPFVVRFPHLIRDRLRQINTAFNKAISEFSYQGDYRCFFPAKVNQHRDVIDVAIQYVREFRGGVEAGSKAELFALLLMTDQDVPILCNGFKDSSIIEMAFRGMQLGRDVTIILEKGTDLDWVVEASKRIGIRPKLGVRVKLAARSGGRWNASGGTKSKFGLSVSELLQVTKQLQRHGLLDCLGLLHFHPGSQISDVRTIKSSIVEAARIYADLVKSNVPLKTIDVGGGLAIDYTGDRSLVSSSKNYSLEEYANDVVYYIQQVCHDADVKEPDIISESGRAMAAHHSLMVIPILENHTTPTQTNESDLDLYLTTNILRELKAIEESLLPNNLSESFHDAQASIETVWQMFKLGSLNLEQRSCAERLVNEICRSIAEMLGHLEFVPAELEQLRHELADTYIANFSLFQAIPDAWALGQIFPVVPLQRLNERPTRRAVIGDITCDSDGQIDCFIGSNGGKNSLPLHELTDAPYYIGIFLIGAYQEALSDDHNLMGNFHVLNVYEDRPIEVRKGASTLDVLVHVHHCEKELKQALRRSVEQADVTDVEKEQIRAIFESVMDSYTYLEPTIKGATSLPSKTRLDQSQPNSLSHSAKSKLKQIVVADQSRHKR